MAMSYDDFKKLRREPPTKGSSRYRAFLSELQPGEVRGWPIGDAKPEAVRSAMWDAARRAKMKIETTVQDGTLYVARPPDPDSEAEAVEDAAAPPTKPESRARRTRNEKNPG